MRCGHYLNFNFVNLTWPPRPQKEKVPNILREVGMAWHPHDNATPFFFRLQKAEYWSFHMRYYLFLYYGWFFQNHKKCWIVHTGSFHKYHDDGLQQAVFIKKGVNFLTQTA